MIYTFRKEDVKKLPNGQTKIKIQAPVPKRGVEFIKLKSPATGIIKEFKFDELKSNAYAMDHEFWDGEEKHKLFTERAGMLPILLEIWETPYDEYEATEGITWLKETN